MYLSQLILNPHSKNVWRDIANYYKLHQTILKAFPKKKDSKLKPREEFGILHRIEKMPRSNRLRIIVKSDEKPNWSNLPNDYLVEFPCKQNPVIKDISGLLKLIQKDTQLRFRLLANPTKKVKTISKEMRLKLKHNDNGRRVPLLKYKNQLKWLEQKAQNAGFQLNEIKIFTESEEIDIIKSFGKFYEEPSESLPNFAFSINSIEKISGYKKIKQAIVLRNENILGNDVDRNFHKLTFYGVLFEGTLQISDRDRFISTLKKGIGPAKAFGFGLLSFALI